MTTPKTFYKDIWDNKQELEIELEHLKKLRIEYKPVPQKLHNFISSLRLRIRLLSNPKDDRIIDIARALGWSRQRTYGTIKRICIKLFNQTKNVFNDFNDFQAYKFLCWNVLQCGDDIKAQREVFMYLNNNIQENIQREALEDESM